MADTIITVHGEHELHHPAERGTAHLAVGFDGPERQAVLDAVTQLHGELSREIEAMTGEERPPITWWSADQWRVWGDRPWNQEGKILPIVYHGAAEIAVKFSDLTRLSTWLGEVALRDGVTLRSVEWTLTEETRQTLTTEARRRAVEAAVAKATVLATSVGLSTIWPTALSDPGMLGEGSREPGTESGSMPMSARMSVGGSSSPLDLKPEEITIAVAVHARFAAS
ncbi:SIMPL domain-containing protein [Rathayibacter soli]|uniref:SIMPL domain-containing protein n=1 Tax=Rathayibacter soli TaxID=3144168 RepID=UPI0027E4B792|nr:SIMPL domain-containing protein [Glaciibacter superstes]